MKLINFSVSLIKEGAECLWCLWLVIGIFAAVVTGGLSPLMVVISYAGGDIKGAIVGGLMVIPGWIYLFYSALYRMTNKYKRYT